MKRILIWLGLILVLGATGAAAQSPRIGVSVTFGDPYVAGHIVIGRPHYHRYARPYFYRYHPRPVIVVAPRVYRPAPPVIVLRPHRYHPRRSQRR